MPYDKWGNYTPANMPTGNGNRGGGGDFQGYYAYQNNLERMYRDLSRYMNQSGNSDQTIFQQRKIQDYRDKYKDYDWGGGPGGGGGGGPGGGRNDPRRGPGGNGLTPGYRPPNPNQQPGIVGGGITPGYRPPNPNQQPRAVAGGPGLTPGYTPPVYGGLQPKALTPKPKNPRQQGFSKGGKVLSTKQMSQRGTPNKWGK